MLKSMTGFGRCEIADKDRKICIEIKGVNHRYLDVNIKLPKKLNLFESAIRSAFKKYAERGKVDIFITYEDFTENRMCLKYNEELAKEYFDYFRKMQEQFSLDNDMRVSTLAKCPEVLTMEEQSLDEEELWLLIHKALVGAGEKFLGTKFIEGDHLKEDLTRKLDMMLEHVEFIIERSPQILNEYRTKLEDKVRELLEGNQIDESRIITEVTLFADRICVDEEVVRLQSHIKNMKASLEEGGGIGRKLDFIAQEMNREANTILSKSSDMEVSDRAIELKTEIEKVREQIQNIE